MTFAMFLWLGQIWPAFDATNWLTYGIEPMSYFAFVEAAAQQHADRCAYDDCLGTIACSPPGFRSKDFCQ